MGILLFLNLLLLVRWGLPGQPASMKRYALLSGLILVAALLSLKLSLLWVMVMLVALASHWLPERWLPARYLNLNRLLGLLILSLVLVFAYYLPGDALRLEPSTWTAALPDLVAKYLAMTLGGLFLASETNYLIRALLQHFHLEPRQVTDTAHAEAAIDEQEYNAGRVIGVLERWIIYLVLVTAQNYTVIALIIAAKGFARFRQMDGRPFAEYVLIGTLMSTLLTIMVAEVIVRMP